MNELPVEIMQKIMSELPADDLISCSKVCTRWKEITDSDILWKPICLEKRWLKVHQTISSNVVPEHSTEDQCQWRIIYDNNEKLYSRWKEKMWTRHSLASKGYQGDVFSMSSDSKSLAVGYQNGTVIIWNISSKPSIRVTIKGILPNYPVLEVKISEFRVSLVQDRLIQVFNIESPEPTLNRVICLDLGPSYTDLTNSWSSLPYFHSWYRECLRVNEVKNYKRLLTAFGGSCLVVSTGEDGTLFTWALGTTGQSKSFTINGKLKELIPWQQSVYIVGWERRTSKIYEYLGMEGCLDKVVEAYGACKVVVSECFIVTVPAEGGFSLQKLRVWSRESGECIGSRTISSALTQACVTDSSIVIFTEEKTIYIWDPKKNSVLHNITFLTATCGILPINYIDARFSDFLVVLLNNAVCVYDWRKGDKLYSITAQLEWTNDYVNLIWTCPTAMVVGGIYNKPELLSFV